MFPSRGRLWLGRERRLRSVDRVISWADDDDRETSVGTALAALAVALVDGGAREQTADHQDTPAEAGAGADRPEVPRSGVVPPAPRQPTAQPALPRPR